MGVGQRGSQDLYSQQDKRQQDMQRLRELIDSSPHRATQNDINYVLGLRKSRDREIRDLAYQASDTLCIS